MRGERVFRILAVACAAIAIGCAVAAIWLAVAP